MSGWLRWARWFWRTRRTGDPARDRDRFGLWAWWAEQQRRRGR